MSPNCKILYKFLKRSFAYVLKFFKYQIRFEMLGVFLFTFMTGGTIGGTMYYKKFIIPLNS